MTAMKDRDRLERETLAKLSLFQAQLLRDAFLEKTETNEEIARRTDIPLDLVRDFRRCRYKALVPAEILPERGHFKYRPPPEPERVHIPRVLRHSIPGRAQRMAQGVDR